MATEVESNDTRATANALIPGASVSGQVSSSSDIDYYSVTASSPGVITFALDLGPGNTNAVYTTTTASVYDPSGQLITQRSFGQDGSLAVGVPTAGNYYVALTRSPNQPGDGFYQLSASVAALNYETENNNSRQNADVVSIGTSIYGGTQGYDNDWYAVSVGSAGRLNISFATLSGSDYTAGYLRVLVYNNAGELISTMLNVGNQGIDDQINLGSGGTYYVDVTQDSGINQTFYSLSLSSSATNPGEEIEGNNTRATATAIASGVSITGHSGSGTYYGADPDYYALGVAAPGVVTVALDLQHTSANVAYYGGAYVAVYDQNGQQLTSHLIEDVPSYSFNFGAPTSGNYYIEINAVTSGDNLSYSMMATALAGGAEGYESENNDTVAEADTLNIGNSIVGHKTSSDVDWYLVPVSSASGLDILFHPTEANSSYITSVISFYDVNGNLLATGKGGGDVAYHVNIEAPGSYYVKVGSTQATQNVDYTLSVTGTSIDPAFETEKNDSLQTANSLAVGSVIYGQITSSADRDYYMAAVTTPGVFNVSLDMPVGVSEYGSYFVVSAYDQGGQLLASYTHYQDFSFDFAAPAVGNYYFSVSVCGYGYSSPSNNFYGLAINSVAGNVSGYESEENNTRGSADSLALGSGISGQLMSQSDVDWYSVQLNSATGLDFSLHQPSENIIYNQFQITVYDSLGNAVASSVGGQNIFDHLNLGAGAYYVAVSAADTFGALNINAYDLNVTTSAYDPTLEGEQNNTRATANALTSGVPISGVIASAQDVDYYVLSAAGSGVLNVVFDMPTDANGKAYVVSAYDQGGELLAQYQSTQDISFDLGAQAAGNYYVSVAATGAGQYSVGPNNNYGVTVSYSSGGAAGYESESNGAREAADVLVPGEAITGQIMASGDVDVYAVTVGASGTLSFGLNPSVDHPNAQTFVLSIYDASGNLFQSTSGGADFVTSPVSVGAGTYYAYISQTGALDRNPYTLTASVGGVDAALETENNNTFNTADALFNSSRTGEIGAAQDVDFYKFDVGASGVSHINFDMSALSSPQNFWVSVFDNAGILLAKYQSNGDFGFDVGTGSVGTYYVGVSGNAADHHPYTMSVTSQPGGASGYESESNNTLVTADSVTLGTPIKGQLSSTSDVDYFTVDVTSGNTLTVNLQAEGGASWTSTWMSISDPEGGVLEGPMVPAGTWSVPVTEAGRYSVMVISGGNPVSGSYQLTMTSGNTPEGDDYAGSVATTGMLSHGGSIAARIDSSNDSDWYRIDLEGGIPYNVDLKGSTTGGGTLHDPLLSIYDASGNLLQSNDNNGQSLDSHISFNPVSSGAYYLGASSAEHLSPGVSFTYTLSAATADDYAASTSTTGSVSVGGGQTNGNLDYANDVDWMKVSLTGGQTYVFSTQGNNPSNLDLTLSLYTPDGHLVEQVDDVEAVIGGAFQTLTAPQIGFTAPYSGTYYLAVDGKGATGTYSVSAQPYYGLVNYLYEGASWTGTTGLPSSISYYFTPSLPPENAPYVSGFSAFTPAQQADAIQILHSWENVANVSFYPGTSYYTTDITFQWYSTGPGLDSNTAAITYIQSSGSQLQYTDVVLSSSVFSRYQDPIPGDFLYGSLMHEIGHALGLDHPGDYGDAYHGHGYLPYPFDNTQFTVMSYLDKLDSVSENLLPGLLDIAAIQYIYGPNLNYHTGNDTYSFSATSEYLGTIWDAGGTDTLDASNQTRGSTLFLTAGTLSSIGSNGSGGAAHDNVGIAFGASIENAYGGSGDDYIVGNSYGNVLKGNGGNDVIVGWVDNDTIDGGTGIDTAVYSGSMAQYSVTKSGNSFVVASNLAEGTDTLSNVEYLQFSDGVRRLGNVNLDFDGDGKSDILWHNANTGSNGIWFSANGATGQSLASSSSQLAGIGDFDGDGKSDILWRNVSTGANTIWKSGNSATVQTTAAMADLAWAVVGVGDFNGDGKSDILWRNGATGANTIWKSGDSANVQATTTQADLAWSVAGIGDFNGDGKSDILWRNSSTGANTVWKSGDSADAQTLTAFNDAAWSIAGIADFNGDGQSDILWRNSSSGANTLWKSGDGGNSQSLGVLSGAAWQVVGLGDYDGDGKSDILWRNNSTGADVIWKSGDSATTQSVSTLADTTWTAPAQTNSWASNSAPPPTNHAHFDFNGDGKSDILWHNIASGANGIWLGGNSASGLNVSSSTWQLAGVGDFNGDGKSDILWRNATTGANTIWKSANSADVQTTSAVADLAWGVVGVGDFDGDGKSDILWRNGNTGANTIWKSGDSSTIQTTTSQSNPWFVSGIGDFDGDGKSDILWRNGSTGANTIWKSGNSATVQAVATQNDPWTVAGVGDFDGDGKSDILWRNLGTGANTLWKSGNSATSQTLGALSGIAWQVVGTGDYDGDGKSDILWRNTSTGTENIWHNGDSTDVIPVSTLASNMWTAPAQTDTWASNTSSSKPESDFNGDGKSDILWRNTSSGSTAVWMSGNSGAGFSLTLMADKNWQIAGTGDFDGDGKADILWRNLSTGAGAIWKSGDSTTTQAVGTVADLNWKIVGVGDMNDDGKSDIFWRNTSTGATAVWLSGNNGAGYNLTAMADQAWQIAGVGDFDGDGKADLLWHNFSTGASSIWKNGDSTTVQVVGTVADLNWKIVGVGDMNSDGKSDILWRNSSSGSNGVWMSGNNGAGYGLTAMVDQAWKVAAVGDFDGDGKSDILWRNTSTGAQTIWKSGDSTTTQSVATLNDQNWQVADGQESGDLLQGGVGNNTLWGTSGADFLHGREGNDQLTGGAGNDSFVFNTALNGITNVDVITDFTAGADQIVLDHLVFTSLVAGALPGGDLVVEAGVVAHDANDFLLYDSANGNLYYDADGSGVGTPTLFATLSNHPAIAAADFHVI